jgi:hypothetical protein
MKDGMSRPMSHTTTHAFREKVHVSCVIAFCTSKMIFHPLLIRVTLLALNLNGSVNPEDY